ncbi:metal-dependent hydrolase [Corynebacterium sp. USCH3]|uniref:metal-dependent hydrolase n=1 Tax=Corynebacterium sp. USCH3 TaxID=3024840 RepID=UPI0030982B75
MGPTHAMSGAAAGAAIAVFTAQASGTPVDATSALVLSGVTAGAAVLPDLDHPSGTAARTLGPVSRLVAVVVNRTSSMVAEATGARGRRVGGHRTLTHTVVFAVLLAVATWWAVDLGDRRVTVGIFAALVLLALHSLVRPVVRRWGSLGSVVLAVGLTLLVLRDLPEMVSPAVMATAVGVGCLVHCAGDAVTRSGVPLFAPLVPVGGDRWGSVHLLPKPLRIRAAGVGDTVAMAVCTAALVGVCVVGWDHGLIVA